MPANLFDPSSCPAPARSSRRVTLITSIALHGAAVVVFLLAPLAGSVTLPSVMTRMDDYLLAAALPAPALPQPPAPVRVETAAANPDAAPVEAPRSIEPEVERPAGASAPRVTGGIFVSGTPGMPGGVATGDDVVLSAPPAPVRPELVRVGGKISPPARVSYAAPVYPAIAQAARVEGTVILEAIISESGDVTALRVLRSVPLLDEAARAAVARWRYTPTTLNGVTVPVIMTVTVTFTLK